MIRTHIALLWALACIPLTLSARIVVFDIHGVLLHEDIDNYVTQQLELARLERLATQDGPDKNAERGGLPQYNLFRKLCKCMIKESPLGPPTKEYKNYIALQMQLPKEKRKLIPFETYQLFCGALSPEEIHAKINTMIATMTFHDDPEKDALERFEMQTFVDTIFNRAEMVKKTMVVLEEGAKLFKALAANKENKMYVYSNAPAAWVEMYMTAFPDVFGNAELIRPECILSSGHTGHLKPLEAAFAHIRTHAKEEEMVLIDDTAANIEGASHHNITGALFSHERPHECIQTLTEQGILSSERAMSLGKDLATHRTHKTFGFPVLFFS